VDPAWLDGLPRVVDDLAREWHLEVGEPFTDGVAGWVAPATRADGTEAVLKVSWPHREARYEADALALWDGDGAVRLLRADDEQWALLVERCVPGDPLLGADLPLTRALEVGASLLRRLWRPPPPAHRYERLSDVTAEWAAAVRERMDRYRPPFDRGLVALGASLLESLPESSGPDVVVHGDFNPGNILRARREPWLVIDPKPMVGDRGYDPSPLVIQLEPPFERADAGTIVADRFARFGDLVGEPGERLLAWSVARQVESALWSTSTGDDATAGAEMDQAMVLAAAARL
jgi:streptomycin 6-kinase